MTRKNSQNNQSQDDNLIDLNLNFKAKVSPKIQEFIATTTEASKTVIKVGKILVPMLFVLGTIVTNCAPKQITTPPPSASPPTQQVPRK